MFQNFSEVIAKYPDLVDEPGRVMGIDETPMETRPGQNKTPIVLVAQNPDGTYPEGIRATNAEPGTPKTSQISATCGDGYKHPNGYMIATANLDPMLFEPLPHGAPPGFEDYWKNIFLIANEKGVMTKADWIKYLLEFAIPKQMARFPGGGPLLYLFDMPSVHGILHNSSVKILVLNCLFSSQ
ncbi:MAG: hypothetical protein ACHQ1H_02900 [Nitrososphaerales archaeon]